MNNYEVEFDPRAENDVAAALTWYDQHDADIGTQFINKLDEIITTISEMPRVSPKIEGDIRRALMKQFPYSLYYRLDDDMAIVRVIAVLHTSRRPDYWKSR